MLAVRAKALSLLDKIFFLQQFTVENSKENEISYCFH